MERFKAMPDGDKLSTEDKEKIMHVALPIGRGVVLMETGILESMGHGLVQGNNSYLTIEVDSREEADVLFKKLSAGGKIEMPLEDTF